MVDRGSPKGMIASLFGCAFYTDFLLHKEELAALNAFRFLLATCGRLCTDLQTATTNFMILLQYKREAHILQRRICAP